jgi:hypothetical protein
MMETLSRRIIPIVSILIMLLALGVTVAGVVSAAEPNPNCALVVPANPLSATGLATPYRLRAADDAAGPCVETDTNQSAFVEAAILDPATGGVSIYHPLVVTDGVSPAVAPVVPTLPANAVVGIWFGSNGETLKLVGSGSKWAVNGLGGDLFGQFSYINAPAFFRAANRAIRAGQLVIPPLGVGTDGKPCPTSRDFAVVDQDQSDNLATSYRIVGNATAQNTAATTALGPVLANGSDERLLAEFIDPALGCTPFRLPSLDNPGAVVSSLVGNELSAAARQGAPVALTPLNDPMTVRADGRLSVGKTNLYRAGVDQPPLNPWVETPAGYCSSIQKVAPARLALDAVQFGSHPGPGGTILATFLADRYAASLVELGCDDPASLFGHHFGHHFVRY